LSSHSIQYVPFDHLILNDPYSTTASFYYAPYLGTCYHRKKKTKKQTVTFYAGILAFAAHHHHHIHRAQTEARWPRIFHFPPNLDSSLWFFSNVELLFVCPALAVELRVLVLAFLVTRPPAVLYLYTRRYVPTTFTASVVWIAASSATLFRLFLFSKQGINQLRSSHLISSTQGEEPIDNPRIRILSSPGINHSILLTPPSAAIPELSQVRPDLVRRTILVLVLPSLFSHPGRCCRRPSTRARDYRGRYRYLQGSYLIGPH
jgi:hypothetical protein